MIKFFRKIRQSMIKDNKASKYLIYAVGEIILVVIGILIALSINNWNQTRLDKLRSIDYHERLMEDINFSISQSNNVNDVGQATLEAIVKSIALLEKGNIETEEERAVFQHALVWYSRINYQIPNISTLDEMESSGDLGLIYNTQLRNDLVKFKGYLKNVDDIFNKLGQAINISNLTFDKYLTSIVDPKSLNVSFKYNFEEMASDQEFINHFSRIAIHWRGNVFFSNQLLEKATNIKNQLTAELEILK